MGEFDSMNTGPRVVPDAQLEQAAIRHILRRYETGLDTAEESRTILQTLGLADAAPPVDRKRRAQQQRSARRSAQRAAARAARDTAGEAS